MTEEVINGCAFYKDGVCASPINNTCKYCKDIDVSNCYYKQLKRLEQENAELKAENERLKALCDTYRTCYQAKHSDVKCLLPKYRTTLQEIKAIAEAPKPFIDFSVTKTAIEVEYDYAAICKELELRLYKVLELITKAEEE